MIETVLFFGVDKLIHGIVSFFIIFIATDMLHHCLRGRCTLGVCAVIALAILAPISVGKEIVDSHEIHNYFDASDILANYIGGCVAAFFVAGTSSRIT